MHAIIWKHRIDIYGTQLLSNGRWELLLDALKAEHVPLATPPGKPVTVVGGPGGRRDAFVYRTTDMPDHELIRILAEYGISARVGIESAG